MMYLLQTPDPADEPPKRFATDTPQGDKQADTHENVFEREHDELINSDAVKQEKASRESLRKYVEEEHEVFAARVKSVEQREAQRDQRAAQKAREREARQTGTGQEEGGNVLSFAAGKKRFEERKAEMQSKAGGEPKSYAKKSRAIYLIEMVRAEVNSRYQEMENDLEKDKTRMKEIDREIRKLSEQAREERHSFGEQTRLKKREMEEQSQSAVEREVNKLREALFKQGAQIRQQDNHLRTERAAIQAGLNKKTADLKRFKRLADDVKRVYENRNSTLTDPFKDLNRILDELKSRFHINLPNLRLAA